MSDSHWESEINEHIGGGASRNIGDQEKAEGDKNGKRTKASGPRGGSPTETCKIKKPSPL